MQPGYPPYTPAECTQAIQLAEQALSANSQMIDTVAGIIRDTVLGQITDNKKALRSVNGSINRTVGRVLGTQNKAIDQTIQDLGAAASAAITQNAAALNDIALQTSLSSGAATGGSGALVPLGPNVALFRLYINCTTRQLAAFLVNIDPATVANVGWTVAAPQTFASAPDAMQWGQMHLSDIIATVCRQSPNVPPSGAMSGQGIASPPSLPTLPTSPGSGRTVATGGIPGQIGAITSCNPGYYRLTNSGSWDGLCGVLEVRFECAGTDNKPAWGIYAAWQYGGLGLVASSSNFDPYGDWFPGSWSGSGDVGAASAWATANMASACTSSPPPVSQGGTGVGTSPSPTAPTTQPPSTQPPTTGSTCPQQPAATCPPPPCPQTFTYDESTTVTQLNAFPTLNCNLLVNGKLPPVGSVEWCGCLDAIVQWLNSVGNWFASSITDTQPNELQAFSQITGTLSGVILPVEFLQKLADKQSGRFAQAWQQLQTAIVGFGTTTSAELLGLTLCRTLLRLLNHFEFGWDLAIWATIDIEVVVRPLERLLEYVENYAFQWEIPGIGEAVDCLLQHTAPVEQALCWMECHGANPAVYQAIIDARREKLHDDELIEYSRRNDLPDDVIANLLQSQGWYRPFEAAARVELSYELPTIQDHLHWLQRNVFDSEYVKDYFLLDGFDTQDNIRAIPAYATYIVGPEAPARNFWEAFGHDLHSLGMRKEYAAYHYAAHWINPSIGQLAEMMQRLRPGRVDPSIQFTSTDFERVIVEQDVAPYFRKRVEAISFRTLPIRQLNSAVKHQLFDKAEIAERWQDIGFTPSDSSAMAESTVIDATRQQVAAAKGYTPSVVQQLAAYDMIDVGLAQQYLNPQGYSNDEITTLFTVAKQMRQLKEEETRGKKAVNDYANLAGKAYADGVIDKATAYQALRSAGYPDDAASLELQTIELRVRMEKLDAAQKAIRKAFLRGEVNATQANAALQTVGFADYAAADYVSRWQLEMTVPRQAATTAMILRWAREGIISVANAEQRLLNIGWKQGDVDLQVLELEQSINQAKAKAAALKVKQIAEAQAAAARVTALTQKQFCKLYTPAKLLRAYAERIIDESTLTARATKCGYSSEQIDGLLKQAAIDRAKKDLQAEKKGPAGIIYTGQGADTSGSTGG